MSLAVLAIATVFIFLAAIVRGYSGFGFSLLAITSLSLVLKPAEIVPSIFMLEIAASLHLLPGIWREVHWRSLIPLILGCVIATPFGVMLLASVHPAPMQLALSIFVLIATYLLWRGFALRRIPGTAGAFVAGAAAGFGNGAFGIAGPPVILFYFSSPAGHAMGRASLIAFFLATDLIGLPLLAREGLVTADAFYRAMVFLLPLIVGVWLGARSFKTADPARFRQMILLLLAVLATLIGGRAIWALLQ
ncbi:MAG: sulfite exporter TauE/SafE family protein [Hyphomicrobiales bacterium]